MKKAWIIKRAEEAIAGTPYIAYQIKETNEERFRKPRKGRLSPETKYSEDAVSDILENHDECHREGIEILCNISTDHGLAP